MSFQYSAAINSTPVYCFPIIAYNKMPPTRRFKTNQSVPIKREITRRKLRKSTWLDLLSHHNTGFPFHSNKRIQSCSPPDHPQNFTASHTPSSPVEFGSLHTVSAQHDCSASFATNLSSFHLHTVENPIRFRTHSTDSSDYDDIYSDDGDENMSYDQAVHDASDEEPEYSAPLPKATDEYCDLKDYKFALTSGNIMALTLLCGSVRFSVKQYEIVRTIVKFAVQQTALPSYSTVQRKLFPHLLNNCFPKSYVKNFSSKPDGSQQGGIEQSSEQKDSCPSTPCSRIVYPTEWAKRDVACLPYFENIYENPTMNGKFTFSLEQSPIVRRRDQFINASRYLFADDTYGRKPVGRGETVSFNVLNVPRGTSIEELTKNNFVILHAAKGIHITSSILANWCVGSPSSMTNSAIFASDSVQGALKDVIFGLSKGCVMDERTSYTQNSRERGGNQRFFADKDHMDGSVVPGDICTLLTALHEDSDEAPNICCVIVSRYWKKYDGAPSQFVIWIRIKAKGTNVNLEKPFAIQLLLGVPKCVVDKTQSNPHGSSKQDAPFIGTLKDGRRYVVYRLLLYCDDFTESGSPYSQKSCGGVYLLPIGLPPSARRSRTAVHVVSLTPSGVSTNEILLEIVPDIIKGSTGVEGKLPSGEPVTIFLDIVGFVADYPAAAEPLDTLGHSGDAPCTHCNIRKYKSGGSSSMGFTTNVHSSNSSSLRCAERHDALRERDIPNHDANILGMKSNEYTANHEFPLSFLRTQLLQVQNKIPLTSDNVPVVSGLFDPYRSSIVAPDHLLSGVARNVMGLCFRVVCPDIRKDLDISICSALRENGLLRQKTIYNERKLQLHSMSLSSVFCVLLVFHPVCIGLHLHLCNLIGEEARWTIARDGRQPRLNETARNIWNVGSMMEAARALLYVHTGNFAKRTSEIRIAWKAKRVTPLNPTNTREVLESGSMVQVVMRSSQERNALIRPSGLHENALYIFVVLGFLDGNDEGIWAACLRCEMDGKDVALVTRNPHERDLQVILLSNTVHRVGIYHQCPPGEMCVINRESREVTHNETVLSGGSFLIQTRSQSYPPRIA